MTLGPAMLALAALDGRSLRLLRPVLIIGKVPMFYYVLHIPLIHLIALAICYSRYGHVYGYSSRRPSRTIRSPLRRDGDSRCPAFTWFGELSCCCSIRCAVGWRA